MRAIHPANFPEPEGMDKRRPVLILTREGISRTQLTVAPISGTVRGLSTEVMVGRRNGLDADSAVVIDATTMTSRRLGPLIGQLFDDQEPELADAVAIAFDLQT